MRVLVLGATGFIGGQIARAGCEAGLDVHGLRRRESAVGAIGDLPVTWHQGDLHDPASIEAAMHGCDVLFHAAAYYPYHERNSLLNTRAATFFNFDWANASGLCVVCDNCGFIHWFLPK